MICGSMRCQAHVAADFQATAGEQFFDIDPAAHDPEKIALGHFNGHVGGWGGVRGAVRLLALTSDQ